MNTDHIPQIVPRPKMDTPTGLFGGACSCGWVSDGLEPESGAFKSALQHADAKNRGHQVSPPGHHDAVTSAPTCVSIDHEHETVVVDLSGHIDIVRLLARAIGDMLLDGYLTDRDIDKIHTSPRVREALTLTLCPSDAWTLGEALQSASDFILEQDTPLLTPDPNAGRPPLAPDGAVTSKIVPTA
jgi:hypothetical protein